jgi:hypothetical protein
METMIGWLTPSPESYAKRLMPLLVSPDLEPHSGAMFNQKGEAIEPTPQLLDRGYVAKFLEQSEQLVARVTA